jgi:hypothetical protein
MALPGPHTGSHTPSALRGEGDVSPIDCDVPGLRPKAALDPLSTVPLSARSELLPLLVVPTFDQQTLACGRPFLFGHVSSGIPVMDAARE